MDFFKGMGSEATRFLDNFVNGEMYVYGNVFLNEGLCKRKKRVLKNVVRAVSCRGLFGEDMSRHKGERFGILQRGIGSLVKRFREEGFTDEVIYGGVLYLRDDFLKERGMRDYYDVLEKNKFLDVYNAVEDGLVGFLNFVG